MSLRELDVPETIRPIGPWRLGSDLCLQWGRTGNQGQTKVFQVLRIWESPVKLKLVGSQWGQHWSSAREWVVSEH